MFYSLRGTLIFTDTTTAVIECGGVGFKCLTSFNTLRRLPPNGNTVTLYTHLNVREDALDLFGFFDVQEMNCFKMLTSVSGVGPKVGIAILSELVPEKVALCIATGDAKSLTKAVGVGTKLAQRIVLELKDKVKGSLPDSHANEIEMAGVASKSGNAAEAVSALTVLGYSQSEASLAVGRLDSALPVEELIKQSLKALARGI